MYFEILYVPLNFGQFEKITYKSNVKRCLALKRLKEELT